MTVSFSCDKHLWALHAAIVKWRSHVYRCQVHVSTKCCAVAWPRSQVTVTTCSEIAKVIGGRQHGMQAAMDEIRLAQVGTAELMTV